MGYSAIMFAKFRARAPGPIELAKGLVGNIYGNYMSDKFPHIFLMLHCMGIGKPTQICSHGKPHPENVVLHEDVDLRFAPNVAVTSLALATSFLYTS